MNQMGNPDDDKDGIPANIEKLKGELEKLLRPEIGDTEDAKSEIKAEG